MRCHKSDGSPIDIVISSAPLRDASGVVSDIMAVIIDTTLNRQLIQEILEISAREQSRIGQDLHDGLSQHLAGIAFLSKVLEQKLFTVSSCDAPQAQELTHLIHQAVEMTRNLAHGLLPVELEEDGLMLALEKLATTKSSVFNMSCVFTCHAPVLISNTAASTHLYRIAQEAVNNAIKHGSARYINISLACQNDKIVLTIEDNGLGFTKDQHTKKGMGLRIMNYRARMIGASLSVGNNTSGGGLVTCVFKNTK
jgi:signal transduction histidine kinase